MAFRFPLRTRLASLARPAVVRRGLASLPNPDPTPESKSAGIVADHAPFMVATYARPPPVFVKGEGTWLWDVEERKYLDFTAGIAVNSLGHCDPEFTRLLSEQVCLDWAH